MKRTEDQNRHDFFAAAALGALLGNGLIHEQIRQQGVSEDGLADFLVRMADGIAEKMVAAIAAREQAACAAGRRRRKERKP